MALYDFFIAFHGTSREEVPFSDDNGEHLSDQVCIQENTLEYICYDRMLLYNHTVQFKIESMKENPIPREKKTVQRESMRCKTC